jgi:hypothetical protein
MACRDHWPTRGKWPGWAPAAARETEVMKYMAGFIVICVLTGSVQAQETVVFAHEKVSFVLPKAFRRMTKEMVEKKYPRGDAPEYVFSNEATTVSIAAGYTPNANLTIEQLPQFKEFMEKNFERLIAGVEWVARGFKEINGNKWIYLEFQSNAVDTEVRNIILMTALDNGLVMFNFNATVGDYPSYKELLEQSQGSIEIKK